MVVEQVVEGVLDCGDVGGGEVVALVLHAVVVLAVVPEEQGEFGFEGVFGLGGLVVLVLLHIGLGGL